MIVACHGGPLDGLFLTTSLPLRDYLWVTGRRCYRGEGRGRHLYRIEHVIERVSVWSARQHEVFQGKAPFAMRLAYAAFSDRLCDGCGAVNRRARRETCGLCGGPLRSAVRV